MTSQTSLLQPNAEPNSANARPRRVREDVLHADLSHAVSDKRLVGLWRLMAGYRTLFFGAIATLSIGALAKTASYLMIAYLVDNVLLPGGVLPNADTPASPTASIVGAVAAIAGLFIAFSFVEGAFTFLSGRLAAQTSESVTRRLRNYLFDHLQRVAFTYHDKNKTGDLITRASSDVQAIGRFYQENAPGIGRVLLLLTVNFIALLILNAPLALMSILAVPFIAMLSLFFFKRVSKAYDAYQFQEGVVAAMIQESVSGIRVVKAFARQDFERGKLQKESTELLKRARKEILMHSMYWPISDIIASLQTLTVFIAGGLMVMGGALSLGEYLAFVSLITYIVQPMRNFGRLIVNTSTGLVSYGRVMEVLKEPREPITSGLVPSEPLRGEVAFEHVGFEYVPGKPVLHDITFRVGAGQSVALLGSTGSGKTTVVSLLPRFYEYTSGLITVDGHAIKTLSREFLRQNIGIVEQESFLFSRTIRENITYGVGREVSDEEVVAAAKAAAVHDVILSFPDGYATLVGERGVTLSGGQKQRVALARTLLKNPRILLLDDATSSVDMETEAEIRTALDNLMENRTTFIIAHRVQSVMNADLILVLDDGRIVQRGTHDELVEQPGIYRQIYDLQARIESELEDELGQGERMSDGADDSFDDGYVPEANKQPYEQHEQHEQPAWVMGR